MSILDGVEGTHPDVRLTKAEVDAAWAKIAVDLPRPADWTNVVLATPAVPGQHDPFKRYSGCPCDRCFPPRDRFRVYDDDPTEGMEVGNPFAYARPLRRAVDDWLGVGLPGSIVFERHSVVVQVGDPRCVIRVSRVDAGETATASVEELAPIDAGMMGPPGFHRVGEGNDEELIIVRSYDAPWTPEAARKDANDLIVWAITAELAAAGAKAQKAGAK